MSERSEKRLAERGRGPFLFRRLGINYWTYLWAAFLLVLSTMFEGITMALLMPLIKYFTTGDKTVVWGSPLLKNLKESMPTAGIGSRPLIALLVVLLGAILFKNYFSYQGITLASHQAREVANRLRQTIFGYFLTRGKAFFDRHGQGFLQQVLIGFTQDIAKAAVDFSRATQAFFTLLVYIVIMITVSPPLAAICVLIFPPMYFASSSILKKIRVMGREYTKAHMTLGHKISNALNGILLVKAYSNEESEKKWFAFASDRLEIVENNMADKRSVIAPLNEVFSSLAIIALLGGITLFLSRGDPGKISGYLVFFLMLRRSVTQFNAIRETGADFSRVRGHIQKIEELFEDRFEDRIQSGEKEFEKIAESIRFENLSFSYEGREEALKDIHFEVKKGEKIALVGATGTGKTTLVNLLMRFYETKRGMIKIDGIDIQDFSLQSLHSKMAIVSQDPFILDASFRVNLIYGLSRKVSDDEIIAVLKNAELHTLVEILGLDFEIGERGVKLSGGEKQRLSIARAILKNAEILILDEATSALDSETEKMVQEALARILRDKTVIAIAHRFSTIKDVDKVVVLDGGKIVEQGTLDELLKLQGKFHRFWTGQQFF